MTSANSAPVADGQIFIYSLKGGAWRYLGRVPGNAQASNFFDVKQVGLKSHFLQGADVLAVCSHRVVDGGQFVGVSLFDPRNSISQELVEIHIPTGIPSMNFQHSQFFYVGNTDQPCETALDLTKSYLDQ